MSKPEDISQEAWDAADDMAFFNPSTENRDGRLNRYKLRETIARAILSAEKRGEAREREACAAIANDYAGSGMVVGGSTGSAYQTKRDIAAAIRNRTATQETT